MNNVELQIDYVLNAFDFKKVHRVLTVLDWTDDETGRVPTVGELMKTAEDLLKKAHARQNILGCGGFEAGAYNGEMFLKFLIEEIEVVPFTDDMNEEEDDDDEDC